MADYSGGFALSSASRGGENTSMSAIRYGIWFLLALLGVLVAIPVGMTLVGATLPATYTASKSVELPATPETVFDLLADVAAQPAWRKGLERVEAARGPTGQPAWREVYQGGRSMTLETTESDPPRRLVRTIVDAKGPFRGTWEFTIEPRGEDAATLTVVERGEIRNPLVRFSSRFMFGREAYLDLFLAEVSARLGKAPPP